MHGNSSNVTRRLKLPKRLYEFQCPEGHITEQLREPEVRTSVCPQCFLESQRIVSAPSVRLEGISGHFPGAYDRWEKVRAEKLAQERKQASQE